MAKGQVGVRRARGEPWPDPVKGPWLVHLIEARRGGRSECIGVEIAPMGPDCPPLTKTQLKGLSLRSIAERDRTAQIANARKSLQLLRTSRLKEHADPRQVANLNSLARPSTPTARRGRPPLYDDSHYRKVATFYSQMAEKFHNPTQLVATEWQVAPTTASTWVRKARSLGYLPPTEPGVAKGRDTAKGKRREERS